MPIHRVALLLAAWPLAALSQKPAILSVVNAAGYSTGEYTSATVITPIQILEPGSIVTIFGANLAASTAEAAGVTLPWQLAGTAVSVYGVAAPMFYVSPTQVNFQWPASAGDPPGASSAQGIVVATAAGSSDAYTLVGAGGFFASAVGIFTQDASGCGAGAVLNVNADGGTSLNSLANSAQPGGYISLYGTGLGGVYSASNWPPDGTPTPLSPLAPTQDAAGALFDFVTPDNEGLGPYSWEGMAPGLVGVAQFNIQIPSTVRQGCNVPLQLLDGEDITPPITISIATGGGQCADPPSQGDGLITSQRTIVASAPATATESDTLTVSLQASPGRQVPPPPPYAQAYAEGTTLPSSQTYFGPACPVPGYRSLGAGTVTGQTPSLTSLQTTEAPLAGGTVIGTAFGPAGGFSPIPPAQSGQVGGLTVYQAALPNGAIQAGSFTVTATGGADVGPFQSTVPIGSPIQISNASAGIDLTDDQPLVITWTGGDPKAWVTLRLMENSIAEDSYPFEWVVPASAGTLTIGNGAYLIYGTGIEMVIEEVPDPSEVVAFSAQGLSLGGQHAWKYTYRYEGLTVGPNPACPTNQCSQ